MVRILRCMIAFIIILSFVSSIFPNNMTVSAEEIQDEGAEASDPSPGSESIPIESNETENWPQGPEVEAEAAIVMDAGNGAILYEKNINAQLYPASITKVMTAWVTLENASLDEVVTFSENAVTNLEADSSHIGIQAGEKLTVKECLYGLMLASANEVANALAEHVAGSTEEFANMMNEKAAEIGCQQTHFTNPHGLHNEEHYTSAYDMALIVKSALENPLFLEFAGAQSYTIPITNAVAEPRYLANHHQMVMDSSQYSYDGCLGGKTGFTNSALNTLVTIAEKDGIKLICVTLKVNGALKNYQETTQLLNYCYDNFNAVNIQEHEPSFKDICVPSYISQVCSHMRRGNMYLVKKDASLILPKDVSYEDVESHIVLEENEDKLQPVVSYFFNDRFLGNVPLIRMDDMDSE